MKQPANIPVVIIFEGLDDLDAKWTWEALGYRTPKRGEHYLNVSVPMAVLCRSEMFCEHFIVRPVTKHKLRQVWVPCSEKVSAGT
jgi:hypothetical protein